MFFMKVLPASLITCRTLGEHSKALGNVAQLVTCLAACRSRGREFDTIVKIDHELISTVFLLPSAESFKRGCCHLQGKLYPRGAG